MQTPKDRYIYTGKIRTRYWCEGEQGSPLLLIHGINGSIENWLPNFMALSQHHIVYAVDMIGHGRTDKPAEAGYGLNNLAQFIKEFMQAVELPQAHIVGHSLGGAVALRFVLHFPTAVNRLVLVSSAGLGKECGLVFRLASLPWLGELLSKPNPKRNDAFLKTLVYDPSVVTPAMYQRDYEIQNLPGNPPVFFKIVRDGANFFGQKESMYGPHLRGLSGIRQPVLVLWGRDDQLVPVAHAAVAAKGLPDVRTHIFEQCGHLPNLEHAEEFNRLVLDFLYDGAEG